ncbi:putative ATP-dependent RNA helicase DHX34 [Lycorma delicatula]|uniref:putative ATP-dependent RNA helicase DHX34 n=1 Tax=Lycorma delicatula TaxID=130591 RepID=UPI003F515C81
MKDVCWSKVALNDCRQFSKNDLENFTNIILLYLDFKQKEKFSKLKKLQQFQADLPIAQYENDIIKAVNKERVVIIAGDTGCGKSTQVPQYLLKANYNKIVCTQPRRIACISLCKRVSYETLNEYSTNVGYQIRFEKNRNQQTKIIFITEGLLLRQLSGGDSFPDYEVIVLDEVHERHLYGDFLLGIIKCLLYQKPNLKLILMSATINIKLFSDFFGDLAQVIQVPGRLHPIKLHYKPITVEEKTQTTKSERLNPEPYIQIMQLIDSKYPRMERGDLLIFLSGMTEITTVVEAAQQYNEKAQTWIILSLHSSLSLTEQDKVFNYAPEGMRKCIVSTNIAETSITIDGIRFVIDSGKVKEMSYDPVCKMQRLKEFTVSRASAEQRKGRAGRTGPGVCYRLYSEEDYNAMSEYTTPEIQRVPLDSLLLQMIAMGLPNARKFPFIEPPVPESIETAILSLKQYGALTEDEKVTILGQMLSKLPVDLPLGKMLITATMFHQLETILSLASVLSVQTPFTNRAFRDPECETSRKELESDHGDPITLLNAFREWLEIKSKSSGSMQNNITSRQWCKRRGLEEQRFYEMTKIRAQFKDLLKDCGLLKLNEETPSGSNEGLTSSERSLRYGEVKLLKAMKRTYQQSNPNKPKVLKPDSYQLISPDNDNECGDNQGIDIRDIDFRLAHDSSKVQNLVSGSTACSYRDLIMIKIILCSGLYPQIAISDEFNHCKGVNDQLYHTRDKPFIWLHPMSFFGNHSQVLQLQESDIDTATSGFSNKNPLSSKHQILCYMSLLETTKPYLVNTLRMPAAQTLLLFSRQIHTNSNFTKIVFDSWLQLNFALGEASERLIIKVTKLRSLWQELLKLKLEEKDCYKIEQTLSDGLVVLMNCEIVYSIKRLLPADLKTIYIGPSVENDEDFVVEEINPIIPYFKIIKDNVIGGLQLSPYLVYNCLSDNDFTFENWQCPHCDMVAALSSLERLQHLYRCEPKENKEEIIEEHLKKKPNSGLYSCPECKKEFYFTPIDILKHKKTHLQ